MKAASRLPFPYKQGDILSFEDTDSTYVDVGFGEHNGVKVHEEKYPNIVIVRKWGKGLRLELDKWGMSELFVKYDWKSKQYISLNEFWDYFGTWNKLTYLMTEEEYQFGQTDEGMVEADKLADEYEKAHENN